MKGQVLLVDDEQSIRLFLGDELVRAGYPVLRAGSGQEALEVLRNNAVDVVVLDLRLGDMDGLQVMAELEHFPVPPVVIMLTAYADLNSAITAMRRGGHDYLLKPCRTEELLQSIEKGMLRRREMLRQQDLLNVIRSSAQELLATTESPFFEPPEPLQHRGLVLDPDRRTVTYRGQPVHLTPAEFSLLACLMSRAGEVVSCVELMREIHDCDGSVGEAEASQAIRTHLWRLRKKIDTQPDDTPFIINVKKQGYRFVGDP